MKRLLLMTSLAFFGGCAAFEPLPRDAASAKVEISAFIPEGTPLEEAKARLEKKGLKCRVRDDVDAARTLYPDRRMTVPARPSTSETVLPNGD